jgi:hypothetical protein
VPVVFDNGGDLVIAAAPSDLPLAAAAPSIEQVARNLRPTGRSPADGVVEAVWSGVSRQGFRDLAGRIGVEPTLPDELLVDVPGAATAGCPLVYGDPLPPLVGPAPHPFPETSR